MRCHALKRNVLNPVCSSRVRAIEDGFHVAFLNVYGLRLISASCRVEPSDELLGLRADSDVPLDGQVADVACPEDAKRTPSPPEDGCATTERRYAPPSLIVVSGQVYRNPPRGSCRRFLARLERYSRGLQSAKIDRLLFCLYFRCLSDLRCRNSFRVSNSDAVNIK